MLRSAVGDALWACDQQWWIGAWRKIAAKHTARYIIQLVAPWCSQHGNHAHRRHLSWTQKPCRRETAGTPREALDLKSIAACTGRFKSYTWQPKVDKRDVLDLAKTS